MALPRWLAEINKRVFNPREIRRNRYPVLSHVGRSSGEQYRTPMDAYPTKDGFVCVVRYGPRSDWVRNTIAANGATLAVSGNRHALTSPQLVGRETALEELALGVDVPESFSTTDLYLLLDNAG